MRFHFKTTCTFVFLAVQWNNSAARCPGSLGDFLCVQTAGAGSFCVPGVWTCQGKPSVACGCDFTSSGNLTALPASLPSIPSFTIPPFLAGPGRTFRPPRRTVAAVTSAPTEPSTESSNPQQPATELSVAPITTSVSSPMIPVDSSCGSSPSQPLFVWAEWPTLNGEADWTLYYKRMLGFINSNCGNFKVTEIILRVTDPTIENLWVVSRSSVLYTSFLSQVPTSVNLKLYPYLLSGKAQAAWNSYESASTALEGVFKYAAAWNGLLGTSKFSGIVVDGEEKVGFKDALANLASYKSIYSIGTFGVAIGYDATGQVASYPGADEIYMELYDFYVNNAPSLTLVQVDASNDTPSQFVETLVKNVFEPYVSKYTDSKMKFMWSVQAKSQQSCLYPLGSGCGSSDDFGLFTAPAFNQFMQLIIAQYPVFAGRSHGIFQFSFVPVSWL